MVVVVSELVTNSVRHAGIAAGDPIDVRVTGDERHVSVSEDWAVTCGPVGCTVRCAVDGWPASAGKRMKATQSGAWQLEETVTQ